MSKKITDLLAITSIDTSVDQMVIVDVSDTSQSPSGTTKKITPSALSEKILDSPELTGIPVAPTASIGTNTTQIATTEFVIANSGSTSLTNTYVGVGDASNLVTGYADFIYASGKATIQRSTIGGSLKLSNNGYNLAGDSAIMIDDGNGMGRTVGLGFSSTATDFIWSAAQGMYIEGHGFYGVHIPSRGGNTGLSVANKVRIGDTIANSGNHLEVMGTIMYKDQFSISSTPGISAGSAAGTSPTISVVGANDCGQVTITTGTSPGTGILATITFSSSYAYPNSAICILSAANANAAPIMIDIYSTGTATTFLIRTTTALTASTTYVFNYIVKGY